MQGNDCGAALQASVEQAYQAGWALNIRGGDSKRFYGHQRQGVDLDVTGHCGVVHHAPEELVLTARAGTPLSVIEATLAEHDQMLPFEPPYYGDSATLGGTVATGVSGPRRAYAGAARDFVLGITLINGKGERVKFGGEVMKNVAGYDVSRLQVGAHGTLGVLLDVSLKVLPKARREMTVVRDVSLSDGLALMNRWAGLPLPLTASCHLDGRLYARLSGAQEAVSAAAARIEGDVFEDGVNFWRQLREQQLACFSRTRPLWRISVPSAAKPLRLPGEWVVEWGGALRWLVTDADAATIRHEAQQAGGHATLFRGGGEGEARFHPLANAMAALHGRVKAAFDPKGILNPGRMYPAF